ncbi:MAG: hypothetical protein ACI35S_00335 [Anaeroplasma sp.]
MDLFDNSTLCFSSVTNCSPPISTICLIVICPSDKVSICAPSSDDDLTE